MKVVWLTEEEYEYLLENEVITIIRQKVYTGKIIVAVNMLNFTKTYGFCIRSGVNSFVIILRHV